MKFKQNIFIFLIAAVGFAQNASAQVNLVPNPSFEQYSQCPTGQAQIQYAIGWLNFNYTPDYFNICSTNPLFSVPYNWGVYQLAHSGNAYAGLGTYSTAGANAREHIAIQLAATMTVGIKYFVSAQVNLGLDSTYGFTGASNNLGILFSTVQYSQINPAPVGNFAHINTANVISDTSDWTNISGAFIADSAYKYIIIGNFFDDSNTTFLRLQDSTFNENAAYYFIDDVCVSTDSLICANSSEVKNQFHPSRFIVGPNPFIDNLKITISNISNENEDIFKLYNSLGIEEKVESIKMKEGLTTKIIIQKGNLTPGVYLLQLKSGPKIIYQKIIIN